MKRHSSCLLLILLLFVAAPALPQKAPSPDNLEQIETDASGGLPNQTTQELRNFIVDGKLRLTLDDAVRMALLNDTDVRVDQLQIEQAKYSVLGAYQPFDPTLNSSLSTTRSTTPTSSQLQGAQTLSDLLQVGQTTYSQTMQTGTAFQGSFEASRSTTNSSYYYLNPAISSGLTLYVTQPLLRNRGFFPNRAPIVIARRNLEQSRATFEAQTNSAIAQTVAAYWAVVGARENLKVVQTLVDQVEATYNQNKRALELGALPPMDIYRSEAELAQRRVDRIQAEYALKQVEDQFRQFIGADLDPDIRALDINLVETPAPQGEFRTVNYQTAQEEALKLRPEIEALHKQLANDDTSIRLAHNSLLPDLELSALYTSNGLAGNELNPQPPPTELQAGFGNSLSQVFGFSYPTYGATLTLNLPLRNRAGHANLGKASVTKRNDLYMLRKEMQSIILDVSNAVHQLEEAKLSIAAAKISRDFAQKNLEGEQRKYELGGQPIFFVLDAQKGLATAEASLVQAEIGYQLATTAVDRATGNLLNRFRVQIDQLTK